MNWLLARIQRADPRKHRDRRLRRAPLVSHLVPCCVLFAQLTSALIGDQQIFSSTSRLGPWRRLAAAIAVGARRCSMVRLAAPRRFTGCMAKLVLFGANTTTTLQQPSQNRNCPVPKRPALKLLRPRAPVDADACHACALRWRAAPHRVAAARVNAAQLLRRRGRNGLRSRVPFSQLCPAIPIKMHAVFQHTLLNNPSFSRTCTHFSHLIIVCCHLLIIHSLSSTHIHSINRPSLEISLERNRIIHNQYDK